MLGQLTELCKSNHIFSMLNLFYIDVGVPILDKVKSQLISLN